MDYIETTALLLPHEIKTLAGINRENKHITYGLSGLMAGFWSFIWWVSAPYPWLFCTFGVLSAWMLATPSRSGKDIKSGLKRIIRAPIEKKEVTWHIHTDEDGNETGRSVNLHFLHLKHRTLEVSGAEYKAFEEGDYVEVHISYYSNIILKSVQPVSAPLPALDLRLPDPKETTVVLDDRETSAVKSYRRFRRGIKALALPLVSLSAYAIAGKLFSFNSYPAWSAAALAALAWLPSLLNAGGLAEESLKTGKKKVTETGIKGRFSAERKGKNYSYLDTTDGAIPIPEEIFDHFQPGEVIHVHRTIESGQLLRIEKWNGEVLYDAFQIKRVSWRHLRRLLGND